MKIYVCQLIIGFLAVSIYCKLKNCRVYPECKFWCNLSILTV